MQRSQIASARYQNLERELGLVSPFSDKRHSARIVIEVYTTGLSLDRQGIMAHAFRLSKEASRELSEICSVILSPLLGSVVELSKENYRAVDSNEGVGPQKRAADEFVGLFVRIAKAEHFEENLNIKLIILYPLLFGTLSSWAAICDSGIARAIIRRLRGMERDRTALSMIDHVLRMPELAGLQRKD